MLWNRLSWRVSFKNIDLRRVALYPCLLLGLSPVGLGAATESPTAGVVVEEVGEGSTLAKAGIRPGDVLLTWERLPHAPANPEGSRGDLVSVFDWKWLELEQAPRGPVEISGHRQGKPVAFAVRPGNWDARVRPRLADRLLEEYLRGGERLAAGDVAKAQELWNELKAVDEDWRLHCWIGLRSAEVWSDHQEWGHAIKALHTALDVARDPFVYSVLWRAIGKTYEKQQEPEPAREAYRSARDLRASFTGGASLALAEILVDQGSWSRQRDQLDEAERLYSQALEIQQRLAPGSLQVANTLNNTANLFSARGDLEQAASLHELALAIRQELAPDSLDLAASFNNLAQVIARRGNLEEARRMHDRALTIRRRLAPGSELVAVSLNNLGVTESDLGNPERAAERYEEALEIYQERAPGSLDEANTLNNLGLLALGRGDLDQAEDFHLRSLKTRRRLAPGGLAVAASLNNLGIVSYHRGDLEGATSHMQEALAIQQGLAPESPDVARSLSNLAFLSIGRGYLDQAKAFLEQAEEIQQQRAPHSLMHAAILGNLGSLHSHRGDFERAASYHERALEIQQQVAPGSPDAAISLKNLGASAGRRGDPKKATYYFKRALEVQQRLTPDSEAAAAILLNLGTAEAEQGHFDEAEPYFRKALEIQEKTSPSGLEMAILLNNMADLELGRGNLDEASKTYDRALKIRSELAPTSAETAASLYALGKCEMKRDPPRLAAARSYFRRAIEVLDQQLVRLGGSHEVRAGFHAQHREYYLEALALDVELGDPDNAFHTLERSRARSFLERLAERDTVFSADVSASVDLERRRLAVRYDRAQREIARLDLREHDKIEELRRNLTQIRDEIRDIEEEIRRTSPRLASLQYPQPLDLAAARASLDPGTLMLSFAVGERTSYLFATSRDRPLEVHDLSVGEKQLRQHIKDFQARTFGDGWQRRTAGRLELARYLYQTLIEPAEDAIQQSERLLIIPDGPLHLLPFASLARETEADGERPWRYLLEWKPLHIVLSATVYSEVKKLRPTEGPTSDESIALAAFGDPLFPQELQSAHLGDGGDPIQLKGFGDVSDVYVRSAAERGARFPPLPYSRQEVKQIAGLYPGARIYLGADATEEQAKSLGKNVRILHFATHGTLDDLFPLNSAVALTIPEELRRGRENGLLQAWEIFEQVRIDTDLVVLSACESGLGKELGGDGLIGLTRAFQYAGARSVAATLWKVPDAPATAFLMEGFYRHLKAGLPKDEALRAAQLELIGGPIEVPDGDGSVSRKDASAPYYWAAFQIYGDWQ